ncbi:helix-turn-helix domain-containing protein [bacterium]|nr:helix-turn-helix domain-containing protein [bacterium]
MNGHLLLYTPEKPLSQFVNHIWYAKPCGTRGRTVERFLPNGSMDLVINLGEEPEKVLCPDAKDQTLKRFWISGLQSKYVRIETPPLLSMIGVEFKPGGAYPFFGFSMSELKESSVDLDLIWGCSATTAREALLESKSDEEKFHIMENLLLRNLQAAHQPVIQNALQMISMSNPAPNIRALANAMGMSHKRFISHFESIVGTTPKLFSRICRFQLALRTIATNNHKDLTSVAVYCYYFDQAHFIKEFEEFSGYTPGQYLQVKGLFPGWISD